MELAEEQVETGPEEAGALQDAFGRFIEQSARLKDAYLSLKEKAERINLELEAANQELQRKVRELDEANNFQRSILESIPTAVVVTDLDGAIKAFNPAAETMWGVPKEKALGTNFRQVTAPHDGLLVDVLAGRCRRETIRRELGGPDGRIISTTACLVEDSAHKPIGAVQLDRDITRLCALEFQLHQQQKLADLGKMAAGLAHEVRKPLNGIKGFASILERKLDCDTAHRRYIRNIMGAADRLNAMLGRLLDFARPDALKLTCCDLREEAEQVAEFVRAEDCPAAATISVSIPDDARAVRADRDKMQQVLLNLVKNGVEALQGAGEVRVEAAVEHRDGQTGVRVKVTDTGRGIAPEKVSRILEPFYTDKEGGTGLGLAIVSRILQLHGTQLDVDTRPDEGTTMAFLLPAADTLEEA